MAVTLRRSRRVWIVVAAVVVLVVSGTVFATARSSAAPDYRTAKAATGDVKGTLDVIGTIQPVDRADLTFPVAGLVSAVPVTLGQQVTAGAVLAQLDTTALDAQVASAASQLATAKAKLAADRSGQGSTGSAGAAISAAAAANAARGGTGSAAAAAPSGGGTAADAARAGIDPAAAAAAAATNPAAAAAATNPAAAAAATNPAAAAAATNPAAAAAAANPAAAAANPAAAAAASPAAADPAPANLAPAGSARAGAAPNAASANTTPTDSSRGTAAPVPVTAPPATGPAQQALVQATDALTKARDAREQHQKAAEAALAGVQHDLDTAGTTCEPAADASSDAPTDVPTDVPACQAALRKVLDGQTEVARLQQQVATDNKALDAGVAVLLQAAAKLAAAATAIPVVPSAAVPPAVPPAAAPPAAVPPAAAPPAAVPPAAAPPAASTPARSVTPSGGTARATAGASAEQLAADQAAVDAAAAQLTTAHQNRDQAALTSPIDGTVGALNLQPGQKVSGAGTAQVVVVGAARGFQVQATVGEGDVARLAVGNTVTVTPDGATAPIDGKVTTIGILPTTATTGAVTYPVTIALPAGTGPFPAGQGAAVAIEVADVAGVLTVPTSAVHTAGAQRTVEVVRGGRAVPVEVQVGAVGATRTEITSGLAAGDEVVLADPSRPLPTTGLSGLSRIGGR